MRQILSVDCGYDDPLTNFLDGRRKFIGENEQPGTDGDDILARIAAGRGIYICACETA